ncbi:hypothetical protein DDZ13_00325 [Coraliomargarita sinensis]|uniref:Uncharacterized protein n=1 Tax=Coraliomargarita sinensis TaxID=2174842 RepID=A0A317ZIB2_9BACT|nr:hypothetical protein DDZ13_00325 [Coraliomargarita sinensis]
MHDAQRGKVSFKMLKNGMFGKLVRFSLLEFLFKFVVFDNSGGKVSFSAAQGFSLQVCMERGIASHDLR